MIKGNNTKLKEKIMTTFQEDLQGRLYDSNKELFQGIDERFVTLQLFIMKLGKYMIDKIECFFSHKTPPLYAQLLLLVLYSSKSFTKDVPHTVT